MMVRVSPVLRVLAAALAVTLLGLSAVLYRVGGGAEFSAMLAGLALTLLLEAMEPEKEEDVSGSERFHELADPARALPDLQADARGLVHDDRAGDPPRRYFQRLTGASSCGRFVRPSACCAPASGDSCSAAPPSTSMRTALGGTAPLVLVGGALFAMRRS